MRRVTLEDIARMANVSKSTVSRVINNKDDGVSGDTRRRVQSVIERLEYKPNLLARGAAITRSKLIGVAVPDITDPSICQMVRSIENNAAGIGYNILLCDTGASINKEEACIMNMVLKHVDGIILISSVREQLPPVHSKLKKYRIPCVLLTRKIQQMDYSAGVFVDNEYASFLAAELLISHMSRDIVFLSPGEDSPVAREHLEGYRCALKSHQLAYNKDLVCSGGAGGDMEDGHRMIESLLQKSIPFSAVLAGNDRLAIGAMKALRKHNLRIPQEVELICFDSTRCGEIAEPALSAVEQPIPELGREAVKIILQLIEGKHPVDQNKRLDAHLIIRKSTR